MVITKEVLDELPKGCREPDGFYGRDGLVEQLSKVIIERMMAAAVTKPCFVEVTIWFFS